VPWSIHNAHIQTKQTNNAKLEGAEGYTVYRMCLGNMAHDLPFDLEGYTADMIVNQKGLDAMCRRERKGEGEGEGRGRKGGRGK
jgi:hypothetical protein